MRIAVNARLLSAGRMEGVARYTYEVLSRMVSQHPEHHFIFLFDRRYEPSMVFAENVTPVIIGPVTRHPILWYLWFEWSVPAALRKYKADIFLSQDTYMSLRADIPTVLVSHDIAYHHFPEHIPPLPRAYYRWFFSRYHRAATKLLAVSSSTADDIAQAYSLDRSQIKISYNACPPGFAPLDAATRRNVAEQYSRGLPYFVYIGSLHPRKNIVRLLQAYEQYRSTQPPHPCMLLLIGRMAWHTDQIREALSTSPYAADIVHLSGIDHKEACRIVGAAQCLLYVSLLEGFGIPILESMAAGVPVITSNCSSMPEVAGEAAILVDPLDIAQISDAMTTIQSDQTLRKSLIQKGLARARYFDWQDSVDTTYHACVEAYAGEQ